MLDALRKGEDEEPRTTTDQETKSNVEEEPTVNVVLVEPDSSSIQDVSTLSKPPDEEPLSKTKSPNVSNIKPSKEGAKIVPCTLCDKDDAKFSMFKLLEHLSISHFSRE